MTVPRSSLSPVKGWGDHTVRGVSSRCWTLCAIAVASFRSEGFCATGGRPASVTAQASAPPAPPGSRKRPSVAWRRRKPGAERCVPALRPAPSAAAKCGERQEDSQEGDQVAFGERPRPSRFLRQASLRLPLDQSLRARSCPRHARAIYLGDQFDYWPHFDVNPRYLMKLLCVRSWGSRTRAHALSARCSASVRRPR